MTLTPPAQLRWLWPTLVLVLAAALRFIALNQPVTLVFDELYYVRDAISQLAHGYATTWPSSNADLRAGGSQAFSDEASYVAHPPLGKWLIGLGVLLFGAENGWGWRSAIAVAGVVSVALTMHLGWLLTRSFAIACLAGLFLAVDGVHVVLSRVALLDGFLTLAVLIGVLFMWRDHEWITGRVRAWADARKRSSPVRSRAPLFWYRPWLVAAATAFGLAAAIKWSGLYALAAFLLLTVVRDALVWSRLRVPHVGISVLLQGVINGLIAIPVTIAAYLTSWAGWIFSSGGWGRDGEGSWVSQLVKYHVELLAWHASLTAEHPYQSHPATWPLGLKPTAMHDSRWGVGEGCGWASGCVSGISPFPNILVTWGGVIALVVLAWWVVRASVRSVRKRGGGLVASPLITASAWIVLGYLSGWLPWMFTLSRSAVFQFYAVVMTPFSALALAMALGLFSGLSVTSRSGSVSRLNAPRSAESSWKYSFTRNSDDLWRADAFRGRRLSVMLFAGSAVLLAAWFFPVWSGMTVSQWFWNAHLWLPGWV